MRSAVLVLASFACGGKSAPVQKPADPPQPSAKRVPIEDDSQDNDDGVTFVHARGHMEQDAVEAGIAPHKDELADCYTKNVGRRRWLGGHVKIHWDIAKDGTITAVKLASESDLGAWPIEKCLLEVARAASFDKPVGGDADFDIPLAFSAKGVVLPWDEDQGLKAVGGQLVKLEPCGKTEGLPDDVVITLYVGPHGKAMSVGFSSDRSEINEKWAECAEKVALKWRLPDPRGTVAKMAIRYRAP
jgi:hypothetical protein